jgi:hypothetical protein
LAARKGVRKPAINALLKVDIELMNLLKRFCLMLREMNAIDPTDIDS